MLLETFTCKGLMVVGDLPALDIDALFCFSSPLGILVSL